MHLLSLTTGLFAALLAVQASPLEKRCITAKTDLDGRSSASAGAARTTNVYKAGACINVKCQTTGDTMYGSNIWDFDGKYYLPDAYVKTGYSSFDPNVPRCGSKPPTPGGGGCGGHLNAHSLSQLKEFEGWRANFYTDSTDKTIGYGHNCDADSQRCRQLHAPISLATGEALLKKDLAPFESFICNTVTKKLGCKLNCNQFGALVIFTYNVGQGGFPQSKIYEQLANHCDYKGAANVWTSSFTTGGLLTGRRRKEVAIWNTPSSTSSGC